MAKKNALKDRPIFSQGCVERVEKGECRKICAEDSPYCPHHKLLRDEKQAEVTRKKHSRDVKKLGKEDARKYLEVSPLRANVDQSYSK